VEIKQIFEEVLEEGNREEIERLENKILDLEDEKKEANDSHKKIIQGEIEDIDKKIDKLKKQLKESALNESPRDYGCKFKVGITWQSEKIFRYFRTEKEAEAYREKHRDKKPTNVLKLDESQLSEMAADEKKNRLDVLNAKLNEITVEIRTSDDKDPARKQTLNQRRTEIQKQINTLRMVEVTK
jgi:hypothetical protein